MRFGFVLLFVLLVLTPACLGSTRRRVLWIATGYVDRMRWFKRVNRWAGNGAPGAARAVQSLLDIGYEHLIPLQDEIGFFAAYDLDILFAVLLALVLALLALLRCCCRCCCRRAVKAKQE